MYTSLESEVYINDFYCFKVKRNSLSIKQTGSKGKTIISMVGNKESPSHGDDGIRKLNLFAFAIHLTNTNLVIRM